MKTKKSPAKPLCLDCADCKGLCLALLELASLPETILSRPIQR